MNEVALQEVQYQPSPQDMAELGAQLHAQGFSALATRALIEKIAAVAAQTAMQTMPDILEQVQKLTQSQVMEMMAQVRALHSPALGYVRRDEVIRILQGVAARPPRS